MPSSTHNTNGLRVVVVGLGFGAQFVPVYRDHPAVAEVGICELDGELLAQVASDAGITLRYPDLEAVLADEKVDAVHLATGIPGHADQSIASLNAGKHTACAVPAALSVDDLWRVIRAEHESGKTYMMMETAAYTREFFEAKRMMDDGEFGTVTYARGTHFQDMSGWPGYWRGLPPTYYLTHAISPILALLGTHATSVRALGAGRLPEEQRGDYPNPFPATTAQFELADSYAVADVTRTLYQAARTTTESFSIYGSRGSFEWAQLDDVEDPVTFVMEEERAGQRGRLVQASRNRPSRLEVHGLPGSIQSYASGGHGGSHPHLVHEFISSVIEGRPSAIDATTAAEWTAPGILAHESALGGGTVLPITDFRG